MKGIRPFESADVEAVAALYTDVARHGQAAPGSSLPDWLRRVVLEQPWSDPEIPPLVATDSDGEVVGFIASHVRHFCLDGRPIRLACSGQLVVAERARSRATGAMLTATYLRGPQDLSITDGATNEVSLIWEGLGGETAPLQQLVWIRPIAPWKHPLRLAGEVADQVRHRSGARTGGPPLPELPALDNEMSLDLLTPQALVAALPALTARLRLRPAYDAPFLSFLLAELPRANFGALRAALVNGPDGSPVGYFIYYARPGGLSEVVSLVAPTSASTEAVLRALFADAHACGVAALTGRVEPRLTRALVQVRAVLHRPRGPGALLHSRDPALLFLATSRHALMTRLEGEWCLAPQRF